MMAQQHVDAPMIRRKIVDENAGGGGGRGNGRHAEAEGAVQEGAWEKENVHPVGPRREMLGKRAHPLAWPGSLAIEIIEGRGTIEFRAAARTACESHWRRVLLCLSWTGNPATPPTVSRKSTSKRACAAAAHGAATRLCDVDTLRTAAGQ